MYQISVLFLVCLAGVGGATAGDTCGDQYAASYMCIMDLKHSDEAKMIMEKKKPMHETCMPDFPKSCVEEFEKMESCCEELTAKAKMLDDPECVEVMNKTVSDVNKCFETEPSNPLADLEMIFMPPMKMHSHDKGGMKGKGGKSGKEGGKAGEKSGGKSKDKSGGKSKAKSGEKSNSTSEKSSEEDDDDAMPHPPPLLHMKKECMPTKTQMMCVKKELSKANKDEKFSKAIETLLKKKEECEEKVKRECELTTPQLEKCFWSAHKDLFKKIFNKMAICMKGKGGNSTSSDSKSEGGSTKSEGKEKEKEEGKGKEGEKDKEKDKEGEKDKGKDKEGDKEKEKGKDDKKEESTLGVSNSTSSDTPKGNEVKKAPARHRRG